MASTFRPPTRAAADPGLRETGVAFTVFAAAKINLYLHITGQRADGLHLLDSLVAFADIGDRLTANAAAEFSLAISGPEAGALAGLGERNLVLQAGRKLTAAVGPPSRHRGAAISLEKHLPAAAGIGGGSSDAAAALRLLNHLWGRPLEYAALAGLAAELGADVPACLAACPVWVDGIGERLEPAAGLPTAGIVLANPRWPLPTADVFRARSGPFSASRRFAPMPRDAAALAAALAGCRNDLTDAALSVIPEIADVLRRLADLPGALLSRMSGSGATCFALFADREAALRATGQLAHMEPGWWSAGGALLTAAPPIDPAASRDPRFP